MERLKKSIFTFMAILISLLCSIYPRFYVFASDPVSQEVTSDDNIVQKLFNYSMSAMGALNKTASAITSLPTNISNSVKETIASLMNGGGIYVDENGDYVFTDEACNQIYEALNNNSSLDAFVVTNFNNFSYNADGYVNSTYLADVNGLTAYYNTATSGSLDGVNGGNGTSGKYLLCSYRMYYTYQDGNYLGNADFIGTATYCYDIGDVAYFIFGQTLQFYNSSSSLISVPYGYVSVAYNTKRNTYSNTSNIYYGTTNHCVAGAPRIHGYDLRFQDASIQFNSFPTYTNLANDKIRVDNANSNVPQVFFYCSNAMILAKNSVAANSVLNQTEGVFYQKFENKTVNNTVLDSNNWENIYNSYIQNVNIDYQENPSISTSDFLKIMKKYTGTVIDAIENGSQNIEESISISNKYLQSISVDVRNISEKLDDITDGGSGGGITPDQYNSIMGKLDDINDNALDIASSTATISSDIDAIYEDTHGIADDMGILLENTADTNINLVAIDTLLQQINSKLSNRNRDNPLPDPDFWDNLDDDLVDYTNTMMEDLVFKLQMIGTVLQGVVPFGYVAVLGIIINALAVQPEDPVFIIDLSSSSTTIPVDWSGTIDLTWVDDIMPMVRAFEVILFIIGMIWASFTIFTTLGSLFS